MEQPNIEGSVGDILEANVGIVQNSRSLPTELLGGHVVPTENVSEGVEVRHAFECVLNELKTNLNETKKHLKRASDYLEQFDTIMGDAEKSRDVNVVVITCKTGQVNVQRNGGNRRIR